MSLPAGAADIASGVENNNSRSYYYLRTGISLATLKYPLAGFDGNKFENVGDRVTLPRPSFDFRLQYKGLFIEGVEDSLSVYTLGYSIFDNSIGSLELIGTRLFEKIKRNNLEGLESIKNRDADFHLGVRSSYYLNDTVAQLELIGDVSDTHDGNMVALQLGRQRQLWNWHLRGLIGFRYFSEEMVNHVFGVSAEESTGLLPEYQGDGVIMSSLQVAAVLPLHEKVLFNVKASYDKLPNHLAESPLLTGKEIHSMEVGVTFVLGN